MSRNSVKPLGVRNANGGFFVGVDGGGEKAVAKICNLSGVVLSTGYCAGSANPQRVGEKRAVQTVTGAITNAVASSGWTPDLDEILGVVVGIPGIEQPHMLTSILRQWNEDTLFSPVPVKLFTDGQIALYGIAPIGPGLVNAGERDWEFGRNAAGREHRSDISKSTSKLALDLFNALLTAGHRSALPTSLVKRFLTHFSKSEVSDLGNKGNLFSQDDRARIFSEIMPIVADEASHGDLVAIDLLLDAAENWATLTNTTIRELGIEQQPIPIGILGGASKLDELLRPYLRAVRDVAPGAFIVNDMIEPAEAAAHMAIELFSANGIN